MNVIWTSFNMNIASLSIFIHIARDEHVQYEHYMNLVWLFVINFRSPVKQNT